MRRRLFRRGGGRQRGIVAAGIPPLLVRANQLLAAGDLSGAADGFEQLAQAFEDRRPRRAGHLYLEAGRASILGGNTKAGMILLDRGLRVLATSGAAVHPARAGRRIITELSARCLKDEAEHIRSLLQGIGASAADSVMEEAPTAPHRTLPVLCPGCGAPVHPDEVEWLDEITAACDYCGTPMRPD